MNSKRSLLENSARIASNRRSFVKGLGIAGAVFGALGPLQKGSQAQTTITDADILNFALNLEYLEAEFYTYATTGQSISQNGLTVTGSGSAGATTGGSKVNFTDSTVQAMAMELASDERDHVALLQSALAGMGAQAVSKPAINLNALGIGFANQNDFLVLARAFEDIGVTAYGGAAPLIQNKTILGYAARILAVEAAHSGGIRAQVARLGISTTALDSADHVPPPSGSEYFPTDSMGLTEVRSPGQVLYLAYASANAPSGGFFPAGVNGNINMSAGSAAATDGATITASPNPIPVASGATYGATTISWNAPSSMVIQVHVNSPSGPLLTDMGSSGSVQTGNWVSNGTQFFLQDVSNGKALNSSNTLASVTVNLKTS